MINNKTRLMGLFGYPLGHTLSPLMHNLTLEKMGLNYIYLPLEVQPDGISQAVEAIRVFKMQGVNVTIPYKEQVIPYLDNLSPEAEACGAVNLIKNEKGRLTGYNTDGLGFIAGLKEANINISGHMVLIGAGGAARAVAYALASEEADAITFLDININKAKALADFITTKTGVTSYSLEMNEESFNRAASKADIIINCSPVGMYPHVNESPVTNLEMVKEQLVLCDLIYNPSLTKLLALGQAKGLTIMNGLPMFVHQGALTLKILTGEEPPVIYMKEVVLNQMQP